MENTISEQVFFVNFYQACQFNFMASDSIDQAVSQDVFYNVPDKSNKNNVISRVLCCIAILYK